MQMMLTLLTWLELSQLPGQLPATGAENLAHT